MRKCVFSERDAGPCDHARQVHHVLPQQVIKRRHRELAAAYRRGTGEKPWPLSRALRDERLQVRICWTHHQRIENRRLYLTKADLPDGATKAAAEYGLTARLERDFP